MASFNRRLLINLPEQREPEPPKEEDIMLKFPGIKPVPFRHDDFNYETSKPLRDAKSKYEVRKCDHKIAKMFVALKYVDVNNEYDAKCIQREVQVLNKIRENPYKFLIGYYGCGIDRGNRRYYLCTEVMDGSLISLEGQMGKAYKSPKILRYINYAVVDALDYLHNPHEIIHRDIKPANILFRIRKSASINSNEMLFSIKLTDFGISRVLIDNGASTVMNSTLYYRAPERNTDLPFEDLEPPNGKIKKRRYGVETDIWSLGLTILEMALGEYSLQKYIEQKDLQKVLEDYSNQPIPIVEEVETKVKHYPKLVEYLKRCIAPYDKREKEYRTLKKLSYVKGFRTSAGFAFNTDSGEFTFTQAYDKL